MSIDRIESWDLDTDEPGDGSGGRGRFQCEVDAEYEAEIYGRRYALGHVRAIAWEAAQQLEETYHEEAGNLLNLFDSIELSDHYQSFPPLVGIVARARKAQPGAVFTMSDKARFIWEAAARFWFSKGENFIGRLLQPLEFYPEIRLDPAAWENWKPAAAFKIVRPARQFDQAAAVADVKKLVDIKDKISIIDIKLSEYDQDAFFQARLRDYKRTRETRRELVTEARRAQERLNRTAAAAQRARETLAGGKGGN